MHVKKEKKSFEYALRTIVGFHLYLAAQILYALKM